MSACQTDSELEKAEGLIETRMTRDDFTVGWLVLRHTDLSLELLSIFPQLICIHKYKLPKNCSSRVWSKLNTQAEEKKQKKTVVIACSESVANMASSRETCEHQVPGENMENMTGKSC